MVSPSPKHQRGYTLLEALVVIFVVSFISVIVLVGFRQAERRGSVRRAADTFVLDTRRAQSFTVEAHVYNGIVPDGYGIYLTPSSTTSYVLFADCAPTNNRRYDATGTPCNGASEKVEDVQLPSGIQIMGFCRGLDCSYTATSKFHLFFTTPNPDTYLTVETGASFTDIPDELSLILGRTDGSTYTNRITVYKSGRVEADVTPGTIVLPDTTSPVRFNGAPSGVLPAGTTSTTISLNTDENATCRWSVTASTPYDSMTNTFTTTGGTVHSTTVSGLSDGGTFNYYVRCTDASNNKNTDDFPVSFNVALPNLGAPVNATNKWAWSGSGGTTAGQANLGWVDFCPDPTLAVPGPVGTTKACVFVGATTLRGWARIEAFKSRPTGWISMSSQDVPGAPVSWQVSRSGSTLSGWAWSEDFGWISFNCSDTGTCGAINYSVTIDGTNNFHGFAWSDQFGWLSMNSVEGGGAVAYRISF